jgi:hypothetical protein
VLKSKNSKSLTESLALGMVQTFSKQTTNRGISQPVFTSRGFVSKDKPLVAIYMFSARDSSETAQNLTLSGQYFEQE